MSSESFQPGDLCEIINAGTWHLRLVGQECTYLRAYNPANWTHGDRAHIDADGHPYLHIVVTRDGVEWACTAGCIRKKRPPREDLALVRWADCPWQPQRERAT